MRIGLLTSVPRTVDAFFVPWIARWRHGGHFVSVASGEPQGGDACEHVDVTIAGLSQSPGRRVVRARRDMRSWSGDCRLDVVLTNTATASALVRSVGRICPVVYFCHGLHWSAPARAVSGRIASAIEWGLLPRTAGVITINRHDHAWFQRHVPRRPALYLPTGIGLDLAEWPRQDRLGCDGSRPLRLLWVGDFSRRKRPHDAVALVAWLRDHGVTSTLTMVGDGPLLDSTRDRCSPALGIVFAGRRPARDDFASADALVHTASWEGLSRVLLEASATGLPSFGYAVKGVEDCPGTRAAGTAGDVSSLGALMIRWIDDGGRAPELDRSRLDGTRVHAAVTRFLCRFAANDSAGRTPLNAP